MDRLTKLKWANKLLRSKFFVLLTDQESAINLTGASSKSFTDLLALTAQRAELELFSRSLKDLVKEHDKAIKALERRNGKSTSSNKKTSKPKRRVK